jgi:hypothetical protein
MTAVVCRMPGVAVSYPLHPLRSPRRARQERAGVRPVPPEVFQRRRRVVLASLVLGVLLVGRVVLGPVEGGPLSAPRPAPRLVSERVHVVQPGDTLWTIARGLQPEGDIRGLVDRLSAQRHGAGLEVGERIVLP